MSKKAENMRLDTFPGYMAQYDDFMDSPDSLPKHDSKESLSVSTTSPIDMRLLDGAMTGYYAGEGPDPENILKTFIDRMRGVDEMVRSGDGVFEFDTIDPETVEMAINWWARFCVQGQPHGDVTRIEEEVERRTREVEARALRAAAKIVEQEGTFVNNSAPEIQGISSVLRFSFIPGKKGLIEQATEYARFLIERADEDEGDNAPVVSLEVLAADMSTKSFYRGVPIGESWPRRERDTTTGIVLGWSGTFHSNRSISVTINQRPDTAARVRIEFHSGTGKESRFLGVRKLANDLFGDPIIRSQSLLSDTDKLKKIHTPNASLPTTIIEDDPELMKIFKEYDEEVIASLGTPKKL